MLKQFETYLLFFIIYSAYGWCMEVVIQAFRYRRFINRGFLIGPWCPIYGFGGVMVLGALWNRRGERESFLEVFRELQTAALNS